jgi:heterodisulfide reductase subunit B
MSYLGDNFKTYAYYPGCTLKTKATSLDEYARLAAKHLGIELIEQKDWQCCGAVYPMGTDELATRLSSVRALAQAKADNLKLVTLCSACHHVIKRVNNDMQTNKDINQKINNYLALPEPYNGETEVVHYLEVLRDEVGFDAIAQKVVNPLTGKKIGAYYGCMLLRPGSIMLFDDVENPVTMENFIAALGGEPVKYAFRNECCGGYIALSQKDEAKEMVTNVTSSAKENGAELLITACPLCNYNLESNCPEKNKLPIQYFTELLADALGLKK